MRLSRRSFITGAAGSLLALSSCTRAEGPVTDRQRLCIQNWADYIHPDVIPEFERRTGIKVIYDTYASNEGLLARMQAGASSYDLVVPSGYTLKLLKKMDLLSEIESDRLRNWKNITARFMNPAFDPGLRFSIPYFWGSTGIGYNVQSCGASEEPGWQLLFSESLKNRVTLLDDARETIGMALKRRGYSYNTTEAAPLQLALEDLKAQKRLVMAYTSDQVIVHLASGDSLASLVFSGDAYQARRANADVRYVLPAGGASIWVDAWCIPRGAANVDNAYKWLDYVMEPAVAAMNANHVGYASPIEPALALIDPALRDDRNLYPPDSVLDRCEELAEIGPAMFAYDRIWTELKCY